jgi:hypothetical protein
MFKKPNMFMDFVFKTQSCLNLNFEKVGQAGEVMNASEVRHSQFVGFVDDHAYFP